MSESGYTYSATSRIPTRPLSYANRSLALPRELILDYEKARIYICNLSGKIVDITQGILDQTNTMIEENLKSEDTASTIKNISIELEDGDTVTIGSGIVELFSKITSLNNIYNEYKKTTDEAIKNINDSMPSKATAIPLASTEKGSVGTQSKKFALEDHAHPKGLATIADRANAIDWTKIENKPFTFPPEDHNHDNVYFKKTGGTVDGDVTLPNDKSIVGTLLSGTTAKMLRMDTDDILHIGVGSHPIFADGKLILNSDNYGTAEPSVEGAKTGQIYLQIID